MNDSKLNHLYSEIAQTAVDFIPEDWTKVFLYGEITEDVGKTYFFYYPDGTEEPVYFYNITEKFHVSEDQFTVMWRKLLRVLRELWIEFRNQGQEQWTSLTMIFDSEGGFKIDYDYEDLSEADDSERMIVWNYTHLGLVPKDEDDRKFLEQYLKNKQP